MTDTPDLSNLDLRPVPGSARTSAPNIAARTAVDPDEIISVTLMVRRRQPLPASGVASHLSISELGELYGADPEDLNLVRATLTRLGTVIVDVDPASRRVRVSGTTALLGQIFGTDLVDVTSTGLSGAAVAHRARTGELSVPASLDGIVTAVLGLDNRPQAQARFRIVPSARVTTSYTPIELGEIYNFPTNTDGTGQTIAIVELGGGFGHADVDEYFGSLSITPPHITAVGVDGADNQPGQDPSGADGEVLLDIEVAGALAPGAGIVVYFAPNTDAGFLDAVIAATHANPTPAAVSISWGQSEDGWTGQARQAMDDAFADAAALGITVTAAAGDNGSSDGATDGVVHVDFPAASPHVLACGGTRLSTANGATTRVTAETVWNNGTGRGATGGGVSGVFGLPDWQQNVGVPSLRGNAGRGVPDVAAVADPETGYQVRVDGKDLIIGGTSAVAPLWAALVARIVQATGRPLGLLQPAIYAAAKVGEVPPGFRDVTSGSNGKYKAKAGWDACTGLGVPDGTKLLALFMQETLSSAD